MCEDVHLMEAVNETGSLVTGRTRAKDTFQRYPGVSGNALTEIHRVGLSYCLRGFS